MYGSESFLFYLCTCCMNVHKRRIVQITTRSAWILMYLFMGGGGGGQNTERAQVSTDSKGVERGVGIKVIQLWMI